MERKKWSTEIGNPDDLWRWSVFGDEKLLVITTPFNIPLCRRILCKIFLGSKFTRLRKE